MMMSSVGESWGIHLFFFIFQPGIDCPGGIQQEKTGCYMHVHEESTA